MNDLHVCSTVVEGDSTRAYRKDNSRIVAETPKFDTNNKFLITYGVFVLVGVKTCVDNTTKQILTQGFNCHDHVNQKSKEMV